jgi:hypothetical protein
MVLVTVWLAVETATGAGAGAGAGLGLGGTAAGAGDGVALGAVELIDLEFLLSSFLTELAPEAEPFFVLEVPDGPEPDFEVDEAAPCLPLFFCAFAAWLTSATCPAPTSW